MQSVLQHPAGTDALSTGPQQISGIIDASSKQSSEERLQVYCNAYFARLLDCLREEFGTLTRFLGQEVFDELAVTYLNQYPSRSYTLSQLGADFPRFLAESRDKFSDPEETDSNGSPAWVQFLIDVATLERVQSEVFDGPGTEGLRLISPEDLKRISPDNWSHTRLEPAPCLRLLALEYSAQDYIKASRLDPEAPLPDPQPTWLAITRRQYVLRRIPLEKQEFQVLRHLLDGATLGQALEVLDVQTENLEHLVHDIERWFQSWTLEGFFISVSSDFVSGSY
ncbi:MAG: hypothetical protein JWM11_5577 [Planctomycetaceae bacterium]|nr:hypothetical protein [Planctomycetaceae bacterium]